ncbi:MAG: GtrA family protein [Steroidobacteraceae bacterium]
MNPPRDTRNQLGIAALYTMFALVATLVNLAAQALCIRVYRGPYAFFVALACGTVAGLVPKYLLDKRYIFRFQTRDAAHDGRLFVLYAAMAGVTTLIFWGTEYTFERAFGTESMRYVGGVLGLAVGYLAKYRLDKRFVFTSGAAAAGETDVPH